jgi:hypothetical protein
MHDRRVPAWVKGALAALAALALAAAVLQATGHGFGSHLTPGGAAR